MNSLPKGEYNSFCIKHGGGERVSEKVKLTDLSFKLVKLEHS